MRLNSNAFFKAPEIRAEKQMPRRVPSIVDEGLHLKGVNKLTGCIGEIGPFSPSIQLELDF